MKRPMPTPTTTDSQLAHNWDWFFRWVRSNEQKEFQRPRILSSKRASEGGRSSVLWWSSFTRACQLEMASPIIILSTSITNTWMMPISNFTERERNMVLWIEDEGLNHSRLNLTCLKEVKVSNEYTEVQLSPYCSTSPNKRPTQTTNKRDGHYSMPRSSLVAVMLWCCWISVEKILTKSSE